MPSAIIGFLTHCLREGGTLPELVRDYTVQAMNGLDTLPHYQGTVYHSEHVQDLAGLVAQLKPGQLVSDRGFLSTSASAEQGLGCCVLWL
ncbi:hypothetical protein [Candidatus Regiella insecticola]|uniref:hypothetical protein n=1 Tax=Candidatus Regiella insecticola TaxID=138073 RepID=UPI000587559F|nr:hypothetical protein [Candidatus Regiella insecticola]